MKDKLYRYLFEQADVRGELVQLTDCFQQILAAQDYPSSIKQLLGEALAATSLLTALLKFEGDIALQLQGDGPLKLIAVNGDHQQRLRAVARWDQQVPEADLQKQFGKGHLVITITPKEGERYQGIVALDKANLAGCLEQYFAQSEQLRTRLWLHTDGKQAAGMLLQQMPSSNIESDVEFEHLEQLTDTIKAEELFDLDGESILHRLYHQESVRLFEPNQVSFHCGCSKERSLKALLTISQEELDIILADQDSVDMNCDYCGTNYQFDAIDIAAARRANTVNNNTQH